MIARYTVGDFYVEFYAEKQEGNFPLEQDGIVLNTLEVLDLKILGVDVNIKELPENLQRAIFDLHKECEFYPECYV